MLLPCQQDMLRTRRDFPDGWRVYLCETEGVAAAISGPGEDEDMLLQVCTECCTSKKALDQP